MKRGEPMKKLKSLLGYIWAAAAIIIALATFLGQNYFSRALAAATGITVNPRYSGGEIVKTVDHVNYKTAMHRPVFDALIGQTKEGFIQINWAPASGLPQVISEGFDYNSDGKEDFIVTLNTDTGKATLASSNPAVLGIDKSYHLKNGWAVRVKLERQP
jgi:hypothetical protein